MHAKAADDYVGFWADCGRGQDWIGTRPFHGPPQTNSRAPKLLSGFLPTQTETYRPNCLDVHLTSRADKVRHHFRRRNRRPSAN